MIADALHLLRTRKRLTQTAASKVEGAPDVRTLSHWEKGRKTPGAALLRSYLESLGLDFFDLQEALDQVEGKVPRRLREGMDRLEHRLGEIERHLGLEDTAEAEEDAGRDEARSGA